MKEEQFVELKANILRTILARRITLGIFAAVALVVKLTSRISYLNPLFYSPLAWFLITFPFKYLIERQQSERSGVDPVLWTGQDLNEEEFTAEYTTTVSTGVSARDD